MKREKSDEEEEQKNDERESEKPRRCEKWKEKGEKIERKH